METVSVPNVTEFVKTVTLPKGRVSTTVVWFMLNPEIFDTLCLGFIRGEVSTVEARIGSSLKHPQDKYDKKLALETARKRIGKSKLKIKNVFANNVSVRIQLEQYTLEKFHNGKIIVKDNTTLW